jgi:hypothetical protein
MPHKAEKVVFDHDEVYALDGKMIRWALERAGHHVPPEPVSGWAVLIGDKPEVFAGNERAADNVAAALRKAGIQTSVQVVEMEQRS